MKLKIASLFICCAILFGIGLSIAYVNTQSIGFDEEAKIFAKDNEKITIMNYDIYYDDVDELYEKIEKYVPDNAVVCSEAN